jgi:hypothetical protein
MPKPKIRTGTPSAQLAKKDFSKRARERFYDPTFASATSEIDKIIDVAWKNYAEYHKSPRTREAGPGFSDPEFPLPIEWLATRKAIEQAEKQQKNPKSNSRILLINGSTRSDQTCPGEMSKTFRLAKIAEEVMVGEKGFEVDLLDLSRLASEYGRIIYPCKACVSTAMPLCHWPCSRYPNRGTGQRLDGRNLPALGCGAWSDDPLPRSLVSGAELTEANDRSASLRRRRKPGSNFDGREKPPTCKRSGT